MSLDLPPIQSFFNEAQSGICGLPESKQTGQDIRFESDRAALEASFEDNRTLFSLCYYLPRDLLSFVILSRYRR
jgi:hypothetical protein